MQPLFLLSTSLLLVVSTCAVELLYSSHVAVVGIQTLTSIDRNGTSIDIQSSSQNNTIHDPDVVQFVNTTYYEKTSPTTYGSLTCSFGTVLNGSSRACRDAIVLERQTEKESIDPMHRVVQKMAQTLFLDQDNSLPRQRRLLNKRKLGSNDFDELNAVFKGVVLKIPEQVVEQKVWPSTLKIKITRLLCGQISMNDLSIQSQQLTNNNQHNGVRANVQLSQLNILCSANYQYDWGWFGGSGAVSAGGPTNSIATTITLTNEGTAAIDSCASNVDLAHLSFSGGITSAVANLFKSLVRSKLESTLKTVVCDELGPMGSSLITDLATMVKKETDPYIPVADGGLYVNSAIDTDPLLKESKLVNDYKTSLVSWEDMFLNTSSSNNPIAMLVPKLFKTVNEYFSNNDTGINNFLREYVLTDGTFVVNFTNLTSGASQLMLYEGKHRSEYLCAFLSPNVFTFSHLFLFCFHTTLRRC